MPGTPRIHQEVHRAGRLVVALGRVEDEAVLAVRALLAGQREAHLERAVAVAVGVDRVGEAVRAVGEGFGELGAHQPPRAGEQLRQARRRPHPAPKRSRISPTRFTPSSTLAISARMSPWLCAGKARVAMEDRQRRLVGHALVDQLRRRDDDAFLKDVGGVGADRAGAHAADVGEMRPAHHEGAAPAVLEDRRQQHLVVGMRDRAARAVAVVVPVEVARLHRVGAGSARRPGSSCRRRSAPSSRPPSRRSSSNSAV